MTAPLSPEVWQRIERLFAGALDHDPSERTSWVESSAEDPDVIAETLRMLRSYDSAGDFLEILDTDRADSLLSAARGDDAPPDSIGPYRVLRPLARGGMGIVYLARDERLERDVALKCLPAWLESDPVARERFMAEARAASALDHPHILTVHDVGETPDGGLYIAMAYYEGETLAERIARGPLEPDEAIAIASQIADGLAAAHARGIVHRDVKPANVLIASDGRARLLDFGIAIMAGGDVTRPGPRMGTIAYMSPEQTRGEPLDTRTDVWSFGSLLYEMLVGSRPFAGRNDAVVIHQIRNDDPPSVRELRPDLSEELAGLVDRCLARDPGNRPADAGEILSALGGATPASGGGTRALPWAVAATVGVMTIALAATGVWNRAERSAPGTGDASNTAGLDPDRVAVLPFAASPGDTTLARVGRDLVITLNAGLDGLGELRSVDGSTVAARLAAGDAIIEPENGRQLAIQLEAGRMVRGALVRADRADDGAERVRADVVVIGTDSERTEARVTVEADASDIGALTDSITLALARSLWPAGRAPSVAENGLTTRSVPALRAFLAGELATAEDRWREAPDHFARAMQIDSTFWLAYVRYASAMDYRSRYVEPEVREAAWEHRAELPERERILLEVGRADSLSQLIVQAREATERLPTSWRAWFVLADQLIHNGMFLGTTRGEARMAIERAVALHPASSTLWHHAFWMALADRDSASTALVIRRLGELGYDSATVRETGLDALQFVRFLHGLASRDGAPDRMESESLAAGFVGYTGPLDLERAGGEVSVYGFHRGETLVQEVTLELAVPSSARAGALRSIAQALAGRGAWDSSLVVLDRYVAEVSGIAPLQHAVRLAAVGAWLGMVSPGSGSGWRQALDRESSQLDAAARAELAWLDGLEAIARSDRQGLSEARDRIDALWTTTGGGSDTLAITLLDRSLAAFELAHTGRTSAAADAMLALERERAERYWFRTMANSHPYLTAVNRLSAAGWLLDAGRAAEAAFLLRWHESVQFPAYLAARADASLRGFVHQRRARVEEALGSEDRARAHYARVVGEFDLPDVPLSDTMSVARAALAE